MAALPAVALAAARSSRGVRQLTERHGRANTAAGAAVPKECFAGSCARPTGAVPVTGDHQLAPLAGTSTIPSIGLLLTSLNFAAVATGGSPLSPLRSTPPLTRNQGNERARRQPPTSPTIGAVAR